MVASEGDGRWTPGQSIWIVQTLAKPSSLSDHYLNLFFPYLSSFESRFRDEDNCLIHNGSKKSCARAVSRLLTKDSHQSSRNCGGCGYFLGIFRRDEDSPNSCQTWGFSCVLTDRSSGALGPMAKFTQFKHEVRISMSSTSSSIYVKYYLLSFDNTLYKISDTCRIPPLASTAAGIMLRRRVVV